MNCRNIKIDQGLDAYKNKNKNKTINKKDASCTSEQASQGGFVDTEPRTQAETTKEYKILYTRTGELKTVKKERFSAMKGKVIVLKDSKIRVIGQIPRSQAKEALKAQGLANFFGFDTIVKAMHSVIDLHEYAMKGLSLTNNVVNKFDRKFAIILAKLMIESVSFVSNASDFRLENVISICLSIYSLFDHFEGCLDAQGLETIFIASALPFLPSQVKEVIKHISFLSNLKILDDFTVIHQLFELLENFLKYVCNTLSIPSSYVEGITRLFSYVGFGAKHRILQNMKSSMDEAVTNKRIFNNGAYLSKCYSIEAEFKECAELKDWIKKNGFVADLCKKWELHMKIVRANEEVSRVEPNLFVFEGPPACGKSFLLNQVVEVLGYSKYVHLIPDVAEGKDFYDSYNNEDVFYMDDVGQKGISQWRSIINMVSSVKMPLDCAEAKLKDTKFFNSHTIVATTNSFMHLGGLCKSDGISNTQALWRRGFVFDFADMQFNNAMFKGTIRFRHYNLKTNSFENSFPSYFKLDLEDESGFLKPYFKIPEFTEDLSDMRNWMAGIIKAFELKKRRMQSASKITAAEKEKSLNKVNDLVRKIFYNAEVKKEEDRGMTISTTCSLWKASDNFMNYMKSRIEEEKESLISDEFHDTYIEPQGFLDSSLASCATVFSGSSFWISAAIGRLVMCCFESEIKAMFEELKSFDFAALYASGLSSCKQYLGWILSFVGMALIFSIIFYLTKRSSNEVLEGQGDFNSDTSGEHTSISMMLNNVFECNLKDNDTEVGCNCVVSGRLILLPSHLTPNDNTKIKIYRNKGKNIVWLEYTEIKLVYRKDEYDLTVFSLPDSFPNPFKNLGNWINKDSNTKEAVYLISGEGFRKLNTYCDYGHVVNYSFNFGQQVLNRTTKPEYMKYDYQKFGLCGSVVFSTVRGILGIHVAGHVAKNFGVASIFSKEVLQDLQTLMQRDKPLIPLNFKFSEVEKENTSVIRFYDTGLMSYSPVSSNLAQSALYGIYPVDRFPADLNKFGKNTLKEVSKKSFTPCKSLAEKELKFCSQVLDSMMDTFEPLTESEIIKGTELLAGLNKDSSNGFLMLKDKAAYIDFESGRCTDLFKEVLLDIENQAKEGVVDWKHLIWVECLKDEIRNEEKEGVPRSFRIGTLTQQYLMKKYFGRFVEHIMKNRDFNKIMVGCNPIKEWPVIYQSLIAGKVFAGDIKNWDGSMNAEIQQLVADKLVANCVTQDKNLVTALASTLTNSLVVVGKDTLLTTHSMPSGSYLTAIMNSLVNKLYTAIWYYRNVKKPSVNDFWESVDDFVYGDDKLNVIKKHHDTLNAISMKDFFESVNMGFTDSVKKPITEPFQSIEEVTFLKRSFRYHNLLKRIVCPLELRVICNTLSYYDCTKDQSTVLKDKINAAQREFYLHPERDFLLQDFYERLNSYAVPYVKLSKNYLLSVYTDDNYIVPLSFGSDQYF